MDTESELLQALNFYCGAFKSKFTVNGESCGTQGYVGLSYMKDLGHLCHIFASSISCSNSHVVSLRLCFVSGGNSDIFTLHLSILIVLVG